MGLANLLSCPVRLPAPTSIPMLSSAVVSSAIIMSSRHRSSLGGG